MDNMTRNETAVLLMHLSLLCPTSPRGWRFWQIWLLDVGWVGDLIFLSAYTHCGSYLMQQTNIQHQLNRKSPYSLLRPPVVYLESAARPHFRAHWRKVVWARDCRLHVSMMCLETRTTFEVIEVVIRKKKGKLRVPWVGGRSKVRDLTLGLLQGG